MNKYNAIPVLADILTEAVKEKVTRMILATFRVSLKALKTVLALIYQWLSWLGIWSLHDWPGFETHPYPTFIWMFS